MYKEPSDEWRLERKLTALEYAEAGREGLWRRKPIDKDRPSRIPEATVANVLELRTQYRLGPQRIVWYLEKCHVIKIAFSSVYRILVRNGVRKLPDKSDRRALPVTDPHD